MDTKHRPCTITTTTHTNSNNKNLSNPQFLHFDDNMVDSLIAGCTILCVHERKGEGHTEREGGGECVFLCCVLHPIGLCYCVRAIKPERCIKSFHEYPLRDAQQAPIYTINAFASFHSHCVNSPRVFTHIRFIRATLTMRFTLY